MPVTTSNNTKSDGGLLPKTVVLPSSDGQLTNMPMTTANNPKSDGGLLPKTVVLPSSDGELTNMPTTTANNTKSDGGLLPETVVLPSSDGQDSSSSIINLNRDSSNKTLISSTIESSNNLASTLETADKFGSTEENVLSSSPNNTVVATRNDPCAVNSHPSTIILDMSQDETVQRNAEEEFEENQNLDTSRLNHVEPQEIGTSVSTNRPRRTSTDQQIMIAEKIGEGGFGNVYIGYVDGEKMCIKKANDSSKNHELKDEFDIMAVCDHKNVLKAVGLIQRRDEVFLLLPLMKTDCLCWVRSNDYSLEKAKSFSLDLFRGINYLHFLSIAHFDLKPENCLISSNPDQLKIADFGLSVVLNPGSCSVGKKRGTKYYFAPELLLEDASYDSAVDIWSGAMTIFLLLTKKELFASNDPLLRINSDAINRTIEETDLPSNSHFIFKEDVESPEFISYRLYPSSTEPIMVIHNMACCEMNHTMKKRILDTLIEAMAHQLAFVYKEEPTTYINIINDLFDKKFT